ncbi:MAG: hypothetical protein O7G30_05060, partial [Proteobacteria bacterium]|nr:hypothetical protein [Pseudomonadota bacterium]
ATLLSLPDGNQYKLLLVAFLPGGALLFWLLSDRSGLGAPRLRRAAGVAALGLVLLSHAVTVGAHVAAPSSPRDDHRGDGGYLAWPGNPPADQALRWIRDHTPHDAVVISRPVRFGSSHVAAVSGRGPFVLVGGHHTEGQLEYVLRMRLVQRLFSGQGLLSSQVAHLRAALDRPLYVLLLRDEHPERFEDHQRRFRATFDEVFRRDDVSVYAVGREGGAP